MASKQILFLAAGITALSLALQSCNKDPDDPDSNLPEETILLGGNINLEALPNFANQTVPDYIRRDNTRGNEITDAGATLGRVLFYDKNLSVNNRISCASCHKQSVGFGDNNSLSIGANGITGRHSMRLINARFSAEDNFFWDERAETLEQQTTMPIQDHNEMGFSGQNGDPSIEDLMVKLAALDYYAPLFEFAFGSPEITEDRMQLAMAQFVRSIQSFDSRYDQGRAQQRNDRMPFPNFNEAENLGKQLFMGNAQFDNNGQRVGGGVGCASCHQPPEFGIVPNSGNNGVTHTATGDGQDFTVTRSPSMRDLVHPNGTLNGNMMHTGDFNSLRAMLLHYNSIPTTPQGLDNRLRPGGNLARLNMSEEELQSLEAFLKTLTGNAVYVDPKWSDPF